jgi:hypothetical protein
MATAASSPRPVSISAATGTERGERGVDVAGRLDLRQSYTEVTRDGRQGIEVGGVPGVDPHLDDRWLGVIRRQPVDDVPAGRSLVVQRDGVFEIEDDQLGSRRHRLGEALGSVPGHVQPGHDRHL